MLNTILIDAGPLIALFDKDDKYHKKVIDFITAVQDNFIAKTPFAKHRYLDHESVPVATFRQTNHAD